MLGIYRPCLTDRVSPYEPVEYIAGYKNIYALRPRLQKHFLFFGLQKHRERLSYKNTERLRESGLQKRTEIGYKKGYKTHLWQDSNHFPSSYILVSMFSNFPVRLQKQYPIAHAHSSLYSISYSIQKPIIAPSSAE